MKKTLMFFICLAMLSGCATTQMVKMEQKPEVVADQEVAMLVIIRDTFFGGAIVFWNYLDGKLIGETSGNTYIVAKVPPGPHYVVSSCENTGIAHFDFQAGKVYYLRQGITMGVLTARTSGFFPMTREEALEAMPKCSYLELKPDAPREDMDPTLYQKAITEYEAGIKDHPEAYKELLEYSGE